MEVLLRFVLSLALFFSAPYAHAQTPVASADPSTFREAAQPPSSDAQSQAQNPPPAQPGTSPPASDRDASQSSTKLAEPATSPSKEQPKRILGVMPNFRAVSAGTIPPPPTPKEAFVIATKNSFDYSSFIFVGLTSMIAEGSDAHPQLGKGVDGFGRYYWRGFLDKTDGNYLVIFALPTVFHHQDERYLPPRGKGGFLKRFSYAVTRIGDYPEL